MNTENLRPISDQEYSMRRDIMSDEIRRTEEYLRMLKEDLNNLTDRWKGSKKNEDIS